MTRAADWYEQQYNARASIPDHPRILADWAERSASLRARLAGDCDLAYGSDALERLDWFPAPGPAPRPLALFIHGGYWRSLDKRDFTFLVPALHALGADAVLVNYTLCPAVSVAEIVEQNRRALLWVRAQSGPRGADPHRLFLVGHSAGAHLVAMLFATDWEGLGAAAAGSAIRGGLALSGVFELEPLRHTSINVEARLDGATAAALSPAWLPPRVPAPLALALGADESAEFHRQGALLAQRWPNCAAPEQVPGAHHFSVLEGLASPGALPWRLLDGLVRPG
ncbi:MAG TPA: alpha/beta hydrolase [Gammaproteobacteria bacterium]